MNSFFPCRRAARLVGACVAVTSLLSLAGCGAAGDLVDVIDGSGGDSAADELEAKRDDWEDREIDSYRFVVVYDAEDRPSVTLEAEVRNGAINAVEAYETEDRDDELAPGDLEDLTDRFGTIPRVFATVEDAATDDDRDVSVEYDSSFDYPEEVEVRSDESDEQYRLRITDFTRLD